MGSKYAIPGVNDLASQRPNLLEEWDRSRNVGVRPESVPYGSKKKVWWVGSTCGHSWEASVLNRSNGAGCPVCSGRTTVPGVNDLVTLRPDVSEFWDYERNAVDPRTVAHSSNTSYHWICDKGHRWVTSPNARRNGRKCAVCANQSVSQGFNDIASSRPDMLRIWGSRNGDLDPRGLTPGSRTLVWWSCSLGHEWRATPSDVSTEKSHCPVCANRLTLPGFNDLAPTHPSIAREWSPRNDRDVQSVTKGSNYRAEWICKSGHTWWAPVNSRTSQDSGCSRCSGAHTSAPESQLAEYVKSLGVGIETSDRAVLGGKELDITVPDRKIAVEFNGLYWHREEAKGQNYHRDKSLAAEAAGYQLIHVWEDDWRDRRSVVERMLARKLGVSDEERLNARTLTKRKATPSEAREFLDANHIQGFSSGSEYYALADHSGVRALVVMKRRKNGDWELVRFATNAIVRGGHSRLFSWFLNDHPEVTRVVTFADRGVSDGGLYAASGFQIDGELRPDYMYVVRGSRAHKFSYRLKRFREDPDLRYEEGLTEKQLAELNDLPRIYDAGKIRWIYQR